MLIERPAERGTIGLQRSGDHADVIEAIAVRLHQCQDFLAGHGQLVVRPDRIHDPDLRRRLRTRIRRGHDRLPPAQRFDVALEKSSGKGEGRIVAKREIQRGRAALDDRLEQ